MNDDHPGRVAGPNAPDGEEGLRASRNVCRMDHLLDGQVRAQRNGHRGGVVWLTGLSGSGKSTLAMQLERHVFEWGWYPYVLDGDNLRRGLNQDLSFSAADRAENVRRVGEVAALLADAGAIAIAACISPTRAARAKARAASGAAFHEIYVKASLAVCEERDPRGLYRKARAGEIQEFTGVCSPYETPVAPDLVLETGYSSIATCLTQLLDYVRAQFSLRTPTVTR
jgi:bifunctional enzyme CysN/CysC